MISMVYYSLIIGLGVSVFSRKYLRATSRMNRHVMGSIHRNLET